MSGLEQKFNNNYFAHKIRYIRQPSSSHNGDNKNLLKIKINKVCKNLRWII